MAFKEEPLSLEEIMIIDDHAEVHVQSLWELCRTLSLIHNLIIIIFPDNYIK